MHGRVVALIIQPLLKKILVFILLLEWMVINVLWILKEVTYILAIDGKDGSYRGFAGILSSVERPIWLSAKL
eukprot:8129933-Ditylum_brightwellii.AAC.1